MSNLEAQPPLKFMDFSEGTDLSEVFTFLEYQITQLMVGGDGGNKFELFIDQLNQTLASLHFILKEYPPSKNLGKKQLIEIIRGYIRLRSQGYLVPAEVYYVEGIETKYLAMSDMTERGKYLIWGYNDHPSLQEYEQLAAMELSEQSLEEIKGQALLLAQRATADQFILSWSCLHVRKHKENNKLDLVLLDVSADMFCQATLQRNLSEVSIFMQLLKDRNSKAKGIKTST